MSVWGTGYCAGRFVLNFLLVFLRLYTHYAPNAGRRSRKLDVDADCADHVDSAEAVLQSVVARPVCFRGHVPEG
jgi:hypothetical protein